MNILFVIADNEREWNSSEWRCAIPCRCIQALPEHGAMMITLDQFVKSVDEGTVEMAIIAGCDIIILQRNLCFEDIYRVARYWQGCGKPVVVDLDDDYLGLPASNYAYAFWNTDGQARLNLMKQYLPDMDALSSPNKRILAEWRELGVMSTLWLPNFAQGSRFEGLVKEPHDGFIVGWGGSHSHYDTWFRSGCGEGLKLACEAREDIRVRICGTDKRLVDSEKMGILDMIPVPPGRKEYGGYVRPLEQRDGRQVNNLHLWPPMLAQFDMTVCPLGGEYDDHRSWIHVLEAMLAKVPFACSAGTPYAELGKWGVVVEQDTPEAWCEAILAIHDDYQSWREKAEEAYKQALPLTMEAKAGEYVETMFKIVQRRKMLLGAKLPGVVYVE